MIKQSLFELLPKSEAAFIFDQKQKGSWIETHNEKKLKEETPKKEGLFWMWL